LGAKIKSEGKEIQSWIFSLQKQNDAFYEYQKTEQTRLIVGYSDHRAKKDRYISCLFNEDFRKNKRLRIE